MDSVFQALSIQGGVVTGLINAPNYLSRGQRNGIVQHITAMQQFAQQQATTIQQLQVQAAADTAQIQQLQTQLIAAQQPNDVQQQIQIQQIPAAVVTPSNKVTENQLREISELLADSGSKLDRQAEVLGSLPNQDALLRVVKGVKSHYRLSNTYLHISTWLSSAVSAVAVVGVSVWLHTRTRSSHHH